MRTAWQVFGSRDLPPRTSTREAVCVPTHRAPNSDSVQVDANHRERGGLLTRWLGGLQLLSFALSMAVTAPSQAGDSATSHYQRYQGLWAGKAGYFTVELDIAADGSFHWASEAGNARGIGRGQIAGKSDSARIELAFIQKEPLRISLSEGSKSLKLSGDGGFEMVLLRK